MSNSEELLKNTDIQEIADKGSKIYESIKDRFEPKDSGKFLAIDVSSGSYYMGDVSSEAVEQARQIHPNTVFYVVKIGYSVSETLASLGIYADRVH